MNMNKLASKLAYQFGKNPEKALGAAVATVTAVTETAVALAPVVLPMAAVAAVGYGVFKLVKKNGV